MTTTLPASSPPSTLPNPNSNPTMSSQSLSHSDQPAVSSISADTSSPSYSAAADSPTSFTDSPSRLSTSFNDPPPFDLSDDTASSTSSSLLHSTSEPPELTTTTNLLPSLLHLSFNQDFGCFAAGTDRGFRIYNCDPFREIFRRDFDSGGGIGVVQMLFRCNILAVVGGGPEPQYPLNKVMIWDDHQNRCIGELSFRSEVKSVRLRRDRIVVVLLQKIFVYNFADLKLLHQIETIANPKGLCEVSHVSGSMVLVCPGLQKGQIRAEHYATKRTKFITAHDSRIACFALTNDGRLLATASNKGTLVRIFNTLDGSLIQEVSHVSGSMVLVCPGLQKGQIRADRYATKRTEFITAHDSRIACFALTNDGRLLATASNKGTLVRIFNTLDGSLLQEVRRGADRAEIYSLAFSSPPQWLAVSSDKGTVHVFNLKVDSGSVGIERPRSVSEPNSPTQSAISHLSFIKGVLPKYFSSEWSVAQFRLHEGSQYIVAFGHQKNTVVILGMDGSFHRCQFDPVAGGEMTELECHSFLKPLQTTTSL